MKKFKDYSQDQPFLLPPHLSFSSKQHNNSLLHPSPLFVRGRRLSSSRRIEAVCITHGGESHVQYGGLLINSSFLTQCKIQETMLRLWRDWCSCAFGAKNIVMRPNSWLHTMTSLSFCEKGSDKKRNWNWEEGCS